MHSHEHCAKLAYCNVINKIKCNFLFVFYIILHCFLLLRHTVYRHKVRLRAVFWCNCLLYSDDLRQEPWFFADTLLDVITVSLKIYFANADGL